MKCFISEYDIVRTSLESFSSAYTSMYNVNVYAIGKYLQSLLNPQNILKQIVRVAPLFIVDG